MTNKRIQLPKDGLIGPGEQLTDDGGEDVEGHGFANPAPPADFSKRSPSTGGDFAPTGEDDDVEGRRVR
ncbi:MAG TPA: hypothetical protein VHM48_09645 [Candidatus Limnocylindrales bacterium]|nr:hypothetical protein [Candidatus Limnocylindrales bacterium]